MPNLKLFSGSSHVDLARKVAKHLGVELSPIVIKKFASGEIYARSEKTVRGADVFVIQTATDNVNEELMELFVMIDSFKRSFADKVHVIMPYFPYSRQDRVAIPREPISAKLIAHLLEGAGADHIISFNLHAPQIQGFFDTPMDNVNSMKLFVEYFKQKSIEDLVVVAPDAGGAKEAKKFADALGANLAILNKTRPAHNESEVTHVVGNVEGKTCVIYDDMVDTGGSVCAAKEALLANGAKDDIYLIATHPVFSDPAIERLMDIQFKEVIVTDTIPIKKHFDGLVVVSIAEVVAKMIEHIHEHKSLTQVYL